MGLKLLARKPKTHINISIRTWIYTGARGIQDITENVFDVTSSHDVIHGRL